MQKEFVFNNIPTSRKGYFARNLFLDIHFYNSLHKEKNIVCYLKV